MSELRDFAARHSIRRQGDRLFAPFDATMTEAERAYVAANLSELLEALAPEPEIGLRGSPETNADPTGRYSGRAETAVPINERRKPLSAELPPFVPEPPPTVAIPGYRRQMRESDILACLRPLGDEAVADYESGKLPRSEAIRMTAVWLRAELEMEAAELNRTVRRLP